MNRTLKIIEFKNIFLDFKSKTIFKNFNFIIQSGEKVVVFGKSGTGKSTLLNLLLGFKQPQAGEIFFQQKKISPQNIWQIRTQIAYVDQDVMMGEGKVKQIINEYFTFIANLKNQPSDQELAQTLRKFELETTILTKNINQLSGGERQRLALAIALLLKRPVMILDEVTSALDPATKKTVIKELLADEGITLLVVTHDKEWQQQKNVRIFDFKEKKWLR